jgi:hypothetical protein
MKLVHDIAGCTASIGLTALLVGVIDRFTSQGAVGILLCAGGIALFVLSAIVLFFTSKQHAMKSVWILAGGVFPFAAFGLFLTWRIGLSIEQANDCEDGVAAACRTLGERRFERNKMEDAHRYLERGCELGDAESCLRFGTLFEDEADFDKRVDAWSRGCDLGNALSCYRLYLIEIESDEQTITSEPLLLLERACELGYRSACIDLRSNNGK